MVNLSEIPWWSYALVIVMFMFLVFLGRALTPRGLRQTVITPFPMAPRPAPLTPLPDESSPLQAKLDTSYRIYQQMVRGRDADHETHRRAINALNAQHGTELKEAQRQLDKKRKSCKDFKSKARDHAKLLKMLWEDEERAKNAVIEVSRKEMRKAKTMQRAATNDHEKYLEFTRAAPAQIEKGIAEGVRQRGIDPASEEASRHLTGREITEIESKLEKCQANETELGGHLSRFKNGTTYGLGEFRDSLLRHCRNSATRGLVEAINQNAWCGPVDNYHAQAVALFQQLSDIVDAIMAQETPESTGNCEERLEEARQAAAKSESVLNERIQELQDQLKTAADDAKEQKKKSEKTPESREDCEERLEAARQVAAESGSVLKEQIQELQDQLKTAAADAKKQKKSKKRRGATQTGAATNSRAQSAPEASQVDAASVPIPATPPAPTSVPLPDSPESVVSETEMPSQPQTVQRDTTPQVTTQQETAPPEPDAQATAQEQVDQSEDDQKSDPPAAAPETSQQPPPETAAPPFIFGGAQQTGAQPGPIFTPPAVPETRRPSQPIAQPTRIFDFGGQQTTSAPPGQIFTPPVVPEASGPQQQPAPTAPLFTFGGQQPRVPTDQIFSPPTVPETNGSLQTQGTTARPFVFGGPEPAVGLGQLFSPPTIPESDLQTQQPGPAVPASFVFGGQQPAMPPGQPFSPPIIPDSNPPTQQLGPAVPPSFVFGGQRPAMPPGQLPLPGAPAQTTSLPVRDPPVDDMEVDKKNATGDDDMDIGNDPSRTAPVVPTVDPQPPNVPDVDTEMDTQPNLPSQPQTQPLNTASFGEHMAPQPTPSQPANAPDPNDQRFWDQFGGLGLTQPGPEDDGMWDDLLNGTQDGSDFLANFESPLSGDVPMGGNFAPQRTFGPTGGYDSNGLQIDPDLIATHPPGIADDNTGPDMVPEGDLEATMNAFFPSTQQEVDADRTRVEQPSIPSALQDDPPATSSNPLPSDEDNTCDQCIPSASGQHEEGCSYYKAPSGPTPAAATNNLSSDAEEDSDDFVDVDCDRCGGTLNDHFANCPTAEREGVPREQLGSDPTSEKCPSCHQPGWIVPGNHEGWCRWLKGRKRSDDHSKDSWDPDSGSDDDSDDDDSDDDDCDDCGGKSGGHIGFCVRDRAGRGGSPGGSSRGSRSRSQSPIAPYVPNYQTATPDNLPFNPVQRNSGGYNPRSPFDHLRPEQNNAFTSPQLGQNTPYNPPGPGQNAPYSPFQPQPQPYSPFSPFSPHQNSTYNPLMPSQNAPSTPAQPTRSSSYNPLQPSRDSPFGSAGPSQNPFSNPVQPGRNTPLNPSFPYQYTPTLLARTPPSNNGATAGIGNDQNRSLGPTFPLSNNRSTRPPTAPPVINNNNFGSPSQAGGNNNVAQQAFLPASARNAEESSESESDDGELVVDYSGDAPAPTTTAPATQPAPPAPETICEFCKGPESAHAYRPCEGVCKECRQYYHLHQDGGCPGDGTDIEPEAEGEEDNYRRGPMADTDCPNRLCGAKAGEAHNRDCAVGLKKLRILEARVREERARARQLMDEEMERARALREQHDDNDDALQARLAARRAAKEERAREKQLMEEEMERARILREQDNDEDALQARLAARRARAAGGQGGQGAMETIGEEQVQGQEQEVVEEEELSAAELEARRLERMAKRKRRGE